ncbi:uncharacterized protein IWZ02DRAFT_278552 [Phyllosticta citriasiana]
MAREGFDVPPCIPLADVIHQALETSSKTVKGMISGTIPCAGFVLLILADICARMLCTAPGNTVWAGLVLIAATIHGERRFPAKLCFFLMVQIIVLKLLDYQTLASSPGHQTPENLPKIGFADAIIIWLYTVSGPIIFSWARFMRDTWMPVFTIILYLQLLSTWLEAAENFLDDPKKETMIAALVLSWEMTIPILASLVALLQWASIQNVISQFAEVFRKGLRLIRSNWVLASPILVAAKQFGTDSYAPLGSLIEEFLLAFIHLFLYFFLSDAWRLVFVFLLLSSAL